MKQDKVMEHDIDGVVQGCSNSSVLAIELLQSRTRSLILRHTRVQYIFMMLLQGRKLLSIYTYIYICIYIIYKD